MISKVTLENFQGVRDPQQICFAPITLIYGANSSGKSSIGRSLNFLRQNISPSFRASIPTFGSNNPIYQGPFVNLGSFGHTVNRSTKNDYFRIGVEFLDFGRSYMTSSFHIEIAESGVQSTSVVGQMQDLDFEFELNRNKSTDGLADWHISKLVDRGLASWIAYGAKDYGIPGNWAPPSLFSIAHNIANDIPPTDYVISFESAELGPVLPGGFLPFQTFYSEDAPSKSVLMWEWFLKANILTLVDGLKDVQHLGPIRFTPDRDSKVMDFSASNNLTNDGANSLGILFSHPNWIPKVSEKLEFVTENAYSLDMEILQDDESDFTKNNFRAGIRLLDNRSNCYVSFSDAGSGLTQVLPILIGIVSQIEANEPSPLLVEQPELHLHPKMQSLLMDAIIHSVTNEVAYKFNRPQIILETHSEAMLLRLQRRIREGKISERDVSIIMADSTNEIGTYYQELRLNDDGAFIDIWPNSFVDLRMDDVL